MYSRTNFQLDNSKFAWCELKNIEKYFKKFERFNRFCPNSIPEASIDILCLYVISGGWAIYELTEFEMFKFGHTRTYTHTSGRQLKITFFDILDYSEYSNTNISIFFHENKKFFITFSLRKQREKIKNGIMMKQR